MALELTTNSETEVEKVHLFSIDGKPYYIPNKVRMNLQLKLMRLMKKSPEEATAWLLEELLKDSDGGYEALEEYDDLTPEILESVFKAACLVVFGMTDEQLEEAARGNG